MIEHPMLSDGPVTLRLVTEGDAELIVRLRNTPKAAILPRGAQTVADQVQWLRQYKLREHAGLEYYFAILFNHRAIGFVRLYSIDVKHGTYSWGSWVIEQGAPVSVSLLTVQLLYDFAFGTLGLQKAQFDVRVKNPNVVRFHRQMGAIQIREDELDVFFEFSAQQYHCSRVRLRTLIAGL